MRSIVTCVYIGCYEKQVCSKDDFLVRIVLVILSNGKFYIICSLLCKDDQKEPRFGALPTLNMATKSHECVKPTPRQPRHIVHMKNKN